MNSPLIDKLVAAGWKEQRTLYIWQHRDGRKLERDQSSGKWLLIPIKGRPKPLGDSMKTAFLKVLNG